MQGLNSGIPVYEKWQCELGYTEFLFHRQLFYLFLFFFTNQTDSKFLFPTLELIAWLNRPCTHSKLSKTFNTVFLVLIPFLIGLCDTAAVNNPRTPHIFKLKTVYKDKLKHFVAQVNASRILLHRQIRQVYFIFMFKNMQLFIHWKRTHIRPRWISQSAIKDFTPE